MRPGKGSLALGYAAACLIWGSTWLAIKVGLESIPPILGAGMRFGIAALIIAAIVRLRHIPVAMDSNAKRVYINVVLLTFTVPYAMVYWAQQFIPSSLSSILYSTYPFLVALFSHVRLPEEPLTAFKVSGISVGFVGVVLIFSSDLSFGAEGAFLAMLAVLASSSMQAFNLVTIRKYGREIHPLALNLVGMTFASVFLLTLGLIAEKASDIILDWRAVGSVLYLATFGTVVAFTTYFWLVKHMETVYISLIVFVNPVVATILGGIVLDEKLGPHTIAGAGLVLAGILVTNGNDIVKALLRREALSGSEPAQKDKSI